MGNGKNTLKETMLPFIEPNEEELNEQHRFSEKIWKSISDYPESSKPSKEEIETVKKVLKYASQCKYMSFTKEDALLVMQVSTNILEWNFGYMDN